MVKIHEQFISGQFSYLQLGFSIKGRGKEENQDNFRFFHDENSVVGVAADGLGSAVYSKHGSELICKVAIDILRRSELSPEAVVAMRNKWLENLRHKPAACDTTLKLVKITKEKAIIGGIGDGWIAVLSGQEYISLVADSSFANQTDSIISSDIADKFTFKEIALSNDCGLFLIATDGFSEDIDKAQGKEFLEEIASALRADTRSFCNDLENMLTNWPVTTNDDDKTVMIVKRELKA